MKYIYESFNCIVSPTQQLLKAWKLWCCGRNLELKWAGRRGFGEGGHYSGHYNRNRTVWGSNLQSIQFGSIHQDPLATVCFMSVRIGMTLIPNPRGLPSMHFLLHTYCPSPKSPGNHSKAIWRVCSVLMTPRLFIPRPLSPAMGFLLLSQEAQVFS